MSKIYDLREQRVGDTQIDTVNFNNIVKAAKTSQRTQFDPRYFNVASSSSGELVSMRVFPSRFPWSKVSFGYALLTGAVVTIYSGRVRHHSSAGTTSYLVATAEYALTGNPCWVYVAHKWDGSSTTIKTLTTEPQTGDEELRWPLYRFDAIGTGSYELSPDGEGIHNMGDINIVSPIRTIIPEV